MKILFFADSLIAGGLERRLLELIKYLKLNAGYDIALVITEDELFYKNSEELGIKIEILKRKGIKYDPRLFIKFYKYCRQFNPDIVHTWGKMTTFYAIPTKILCKKPLISNLIANSNRNFKTWSADNFFYKVNICFADIILSNSCAGIKAYGLKTKKAHVIRNGVSLSRFDVQINKNAEKHRLKIDSIYMIVMVACFTMSKDYDLFVDVAKEMGKEMKAVTFVAVGDGPDQQRIKARIEKENLTNIILTGDQKNVESIIAASDIGLLCTYSEGISNSVIEYMALGKPVIVTDLTGGSKEIVVEGETGYCTERDPVTIINHINRLLNDEKLRISMGEKGRERITQHFSIERMGREFLNLYKKVVTKNSINNRSKVK